MSELSLTADMVRELSEQTRLTPAQLQRLHRRFCKLDPGNKGRIPCEALASLPGLEASPLSGRIINVLSRKGTAGVTAPLARANGSSTIPPSEKPEDTSAPADVDFAGFVRVLACFSDQATSRERLQFTFDLYDVDADGRISNRDLFIMLQIMVGTSLTDIQLQQIVDKTFIEGDRDRDGYISLLEFETLVVANDLLPKFTLPI